MLAMYFATELLSGIYQIITYSSKLQDKAAELGSEFNSTASDIDSYNEKIKSLKDTMNDSTSSYEDVTQAREELMKIQDELIVKYGKEEGAIQTITDAIKDQDSTLDGLTDSAYQKLVNEFNKNEKWSDKLQSAFFGSNFSQMLDTMEGGYRSVISMTLCFKL